MIPWMSGHIRLLIRRRDRAFNKYKRTRSLLHKDSWHHARTLANHAIQQAKRSYNDRLSTTLSDPSCTPKDFWRITKDIIGNKSVCNIPTITDNGISYATSALKANLFSDYFSAQSNINTTQYPDIPHLPDRVGDTLESVYVSELEVYKILKCLKVKKASGPDSISNRILKECALSLAGPLHKLYNYSFSSGEFPITWKLSNTCPIHKTAERYIKTNYRPVSL